MTSLDISNRTAYLGGSDMAAVLGVDRWRTPVDVYLEKIGEAPGFAGNEVTDLGTRFEGEVARIYAERTGVAIHEDPSGVQHPDHPWAVAHVDRFTDDESRIVEIKCSSASGWGDEGTDEIPDHYLPQVHHYLGVTGAQVCDVAALLWGNHGPPTVRIYTVPRDEEMVGILFEAGAKFWHDHVIPRKAPDPTTEADAGKLWREAVKGAAVDVGEDVVETLRRLEDLKQTMKAAKDAESALKLQLKEAFRFATDDGKFASAEEIHYGGAPLCTWKTQTRRTFDAKRFREEHPEIAADFFTESTFRVLRTTAHGKATITPNP